MMSDSIKKLRFFYSFLMKRMVHVNLQLLYRCNFRCSICDFWKDEYKDYPVMTIDQVKTVSEKLKRLGPQIISIGGGEPLLHPDIIEIVKILAKDHFPVMICNGWYMTPELARSLFSAGIHEISISIDYIDKSKHDRQRNMPGAFERGTEALKMLNENRVSPHQRVHMISVVMDDNIADIEYLIKLSREMGITYLVTLYSSCRGEKDPRCSTTDISSAMLSLKKKYPEFVALRGYLRRFTEAVREKGAAPCYAGKNLMNIDSRGSVTFCIDNLDNPAGNIFTDDIFDIQNSLLDRHKKNNCAKCWTSCRGSIETIMYGNDRMANAFDYYRMIKDVPLQRGNYAGRK